MKKKNHFRRAKIERYSQWTKYKMIDLASRVNEFRLNLDPRVAPGPKFVTAARPAARENSSTMYITPQIFLSHTTGVFKQWVATDFLLGRRAEVGYQQTRVHSFIVLDLVLVLSVNQIVLLITSKQHCNYIPKG